MVVFSRGPPPPAETLPPGEGGPLKEAWFMDSASGSMTPLSPRPHADYHPYYPRGGAALRRSSSHPPETASSTALRRVEGTHRRIIMGWPHTRCGGGGMCLETRGARPLTLTAPDGV